MNSLYIFDSKQTVDDIKDYINCDNMAVIDIDCMSNENNYTKSYHVVVEGRELTRFNKIAIQGTPQMAVDKEAICLSRVYSYYPKCNFPLFYV